VNLSLFVPEMFLLAWSFLLLFVGLILTRRKGLIKWIAFLGFLIALLLEAAYFPIDGKGFFGMLKVTSYLRIFDLIFLLGGALVILLFADYFTETPLEAMFFLYTATLGMMLFAKSYDLVMVFFSLELLSFSLFYLIGLLRHWKGSQEALLKFFILALFSSGLFLMGIALLYGEFGGTSFRLIAAHIPLHPDPALIVSLTLIFVGFGFKLVFIPFHLWAPDIFLGAPVPVVAFLTGAPKAAAFAALLNVLKISMKPLSEIWIPIIVILSVLTMFAGNLAALREKDLKRMLAFSTVAHAGYILVAFVAVNEMGMASMLFYLVTYIFMTLGAFASLAFLGERVNLEKIKGLSRSQPGIALSFSFFLISLAGIPPTAGFIAKFQVFMSAVNAKHTTLAWFGFLNSVIAAFYYLRVVVLMYMEKEREPAQIPDFPWIYSVIWVSAIFVLLLGIFPSFLLNLIKSTF